MRAAAQNDNKALVFGGRDFELGRGVKQNREEAVKYYEKARELSNTDAMNWLGLMKLEEKDYKAAAELFQQAAAHGDLNGLYNLASRYRDGLGVEKKDVIKAAGLYRKILNKNSPEGKYKTTVERAKKSLKELFEENSGLEAYINYLEQINNDETEDAALKELLKSQEEGLLEAALESGRIFFEGGEDKIDLQQAEYYYFMAAKKGSETAKEKLAELRQKITDSEEQCQRAQEYRNEKDNPLHNNELAHYWSMQAATQGHFEALEAVADDFGTGRGVQKNTEEAIKYYQQAADKGSARAMNFIGVNKLDKKEYKAAIELFQQAANKGDSYGFNNLGTCYHNGLGVPKNPVQAAIFYNSALKQQDIPAVRNNLKNLYGNNAGLEEYMAYLDMENKESPEALTLLKISAKKGFDEAVKVRAQVKARIKGENDLGYRYLYAEQLEKREAYREAINAYKQAASYGYKPLECYINIAKICLKKRPYAWGNDKAALKAFERAAISGSAEGYFEAAKLLEKGVMTNKQKVTWKKSYEFALEYYKKAADQNFPGAKEALDVAKEKFYKEAMRPVERNADLLKLLAEIYGYAPAQSALANYYKTSTEQVPKAKRESLYKAAAEQGYADAMIDLGMWYWNQENWAEAFSWFQKAADKNDPIGLYNVALCYYTGRGVEKDIVKRVTFYREILAKNLSEGQYGELLNNTKKYLEKSYTENLGLKIYMEDPAIKNKTLQGFADERYKLAQTYEIKGEAQGAFKLYKQAADLGHKKAQMDVARMYIEGKGTEKNAKLSQEYTEKALDQILQEIQAIPVGNSAAPVATHVAEMPAKNPEKIAAELYKKQLKNTKDTDKSKPQLYPNLPEISPQAAAPDKPSAAPAYKAVTAMQAPEPVPVKSNMENAEKTGEELYKKYLENTEDIEFLKASTEKGFADAQNRLGTILEVEEDYEKALELYHLAAAQNNPRALYNLWRLYQYGKGVTKDEQKAQEFFDAAKKAGFVPPSKEKRSHAKAAKELGVFKAEPKLVDTLPEVPTTPILPNAPTHKPEPAQEETPSPIHTTTPVKDQ